MNCWFCGGVLIWQSDFDAEDFGYNRAGLVSILSCSNCEAQWEGVQLEEEEIDE